MELKMAMKSISDIDFGLNKLSHKSEAFHSKNQIGILLHLNWNNLKTR